MFNAQSHVLLIVSASTLVACTMGDGEAADDLASAPPLKISAAALVADPPPRPADTQRPLDPARITPAMVALGDSVFHGKVGGGSCVTCHGPHGRHGVAGPNLTDGEWLHSDGSYAAIARTITAGVVEPQRYVGVMPPHGGVVMPDEHLRAVAAYVYAISHK